LPGVVCGATALFISDRCDRKRAAASAINRANEPTAANRRSEIMAIQHIQHIAARQAAHDAMTKADTGLAAIEAG
jgi:hypothetical protein